METRGASAYSHVSSRDQDRERRVQGRIQFENDQEFGLQYQNQDFEEEGFSKQQLDPADKVEIISSHDDKQPVPLASFEDACLPEFVRHAIRALGFKEPTAVQKYCNLRFSSSAIPIAISGRDMIGIAKTGSGKTFSYMIPCLMKIAEDKRQRQQVNRMMESRVRYTPTGLVLAPTRELAIQIHSAALSLAQRSGLKVCVVYGGANKGSQLGELSGGVDILIATPGRLIDFFRGGSLRLSNVNFFVLDEADRMLVGYL